MTDHQFHCRIVIPCLVVLVLSLAINTIGGTVAEAVAFLVSSGGVAVVFGGNLAWTVLRERLHRHG